MVAIDGARARTRFGGWTDQRLRELDALDRAVYQAIAVVPTPTLDRALARLSSAADHSKLWLAVAGMLAATGGRRGRRAAADAMLSIGVSSLVTNVAAKAAFSRRRPDRAGESVPELRWVRMPSSTSFPSGHSASAFAFASAIGAAYPALALPVQMLAAAVAYSRVHTGVHYPGDAIAGSLIGAGSAAIVCGAGRRRRASASGRSPSARWAQVIRAYAT